MSTPTTITLSGVKRYAFTTPGVYNVTVPPNAVGLTCLLVGGGGGGGGAIGSSHAGGGGSGCCILFDILFNGTTQTITVYVGVKGFGATFLSIGPGGGGTNSYLTLNPGIGGITTVSAGGGGGGAGTDSQIGNPGIGDGGGAAGVVARGGGGGGTAIGAPNICIMTNNGFSGGNGTDGFASGGTGYGAATGSSGNATIYGAGGGYKSAGSGGGNGADGLVTIKWIYSY